MDLKNIIEKNLCLGCGICMYDTKLSIMQFNSNRGLFQPKIDLKESYPLAEEICPARGYSIIEDAKKLYPKAIESLEIGRYNQSFVGHSTSSKTLKNASSGGVITELFLYLLDKKIIDYVVVTKFEYTKNGPITKTVLTKNREEILESQGSKYCPVDVSKTIESIKKTKGKLAYLGTPCQIAGIRTIQKIDKEFRDKIVITVANFCGGFKSYNFMQSIANRHSVDYKKITFFRFRGGGQPGSMLMKDINNNQFEISYQVYGGYSGYTKMLRCHLCVDATGELADISVGDAWLEKFLNDEYPWSVILTRNSFTTQIIKDMEHENLLKIEYLSEEEVIKSQKSNITSKKYRQFSRMNLYKRMGYLLPKFDGGYVFKNTSLKTEIMIFCKHKFLERLEKLGLYKYFRMLFRKGY